MMSELVNVALLIAMLVIMYFVIKIYLVVTEATYCERRVQALEMEAGHSTCHTQADPRLAVRKTDRETINLRAAGNRARAQEHDEGLC